MCSSFVICSLHNGAWNIFTSVAADVFQGGASFGKISDMVFPKSRKNLNGRNLYARADGGNAIILDDDDLIFEKLVTRAIE
jgi:hypothetical protein